MGRCTGRRDITEINQSNIAVTKVNLMDLDQSQRLLLVIIVSYCKTL